MTSIGQHSPQPADHRQRYHGDFLSTRLYWIQALAGDGLLESIHTIRIN